jgi:hypothetical protein
LALPARSPNLNAYAERWVRSDAEILFKGPGPPQTPEAFHHPCIWQWALGEPLHRLLPPLFVPIHSNVLSIFSSSSSQISLVRTLLSPLSKAFTATSLARWKAALGVA